MAILELATCTCNCQWTLETIRTVLTCDSDFTVYHRKLTRVGTCRGRYMYIGGCGVGCDLIGQSWKLEARCM